MIMLMMRELPLFPDNLCFVDLDSEAAGFYELEALDRKRWMKSKAVCRCRFNRQNFPSAPCLIVRADRRETEWGPYLMVSVDRERIGLKHIPQYGTYYFPFSASLLARGTEDSVEVCLEAMCAPGTVNGDSRELALAVFELRIIDLNRDDFPERQEFLLQRKIFEPGPGGLAAQVLTHHKFVTTDRILDVGAGNGWTTMLLAGHSGANACGIDLYDYSHVGRSSFKSEVLERFARHRVALLPVPSLALMSDPATLRKTLSRCDFSTVNAGQMPWRNDYFDFVFSLNVMEHVSEPGRVLAEIQRVLRPGGQALLMFWPLYHSDSGSHLPATIGFNRPWVQLLMDRAEIKNAVCAAGGVPFEVDNILNTLNGWKPAQFIDLFENSGMNILASETHRGFSLPGAEQSPEFQALKAHYSEEDLTTIGMTWHLERGNGAPANRRFRPPLKSFWRT
jgi:SAM-dependent methyltransferase